MHFSAADAESGLSRMRYHLEEKIKVEIILASGSPRRKELMEQMGLDFTVCPAKGKETITKSRPAEIVEELSMQKALEVASGLVSFQESRRELITPDDFLVIGADTLVFQENDILGKPADEEAAKDMLRNLSGKTHQVYTGVTFVLHSREGKSGAISFHERTDVVFYPLTEKEISDYVASGEPMDKAGSYGIQGKAAVFVKEIKGDYFNVVGFPVSRVYHELKKLKEM